LSVLRDICDDDVHFDAPSFKRRDGF